MKLLNILVFFLTSLFLINCLYAQNDRRSRHEKYLMKYHYLGSNNQDPRMKSLDHDKDRFNLAVTMFQKMAGLKQTGEVNAETQDMMDAPRCGMPDLVNKMSITRKRRYAALGPAWPKSTLTYKFINYSPDLNASTIKREIYKAFKMWQDVSALTFTEVQPPQAADIDITFVSRAHGDGNDFDGPNGVLAHAYFPTNGDAHFDEAETWTVGEARGINLLQVAAHEFGHSLGLGHSDVQGAIMLPFYMSYTPNFALGIDDIRGIQQLYGPPRLSSTQLTTPFVMPTISIPVTRGPGIPATSRPSSGRLCDSTPPDAVFAIYSTIFVIKADKFYLLNGPMMTSNTEYNIKDYFPGVPNNIDAATYISNLSVVRASPYEEGDIVFFKDAQVWRFRYTSNTIRAVPGNPRPFSDEFRGLPANVEAAFVWSHNGKLYFTKDASYYGYSTNNKEIGSQYPLPLASFWEGVPNKLTAAFAYNPRRNNARTYFFDADKVYKFDDVQMKVDRASIVKARWFFGCANTETAAQRLVAAAPPLLHSLSLLLLANFYAIYRI